LAKPLTLAEGKNPCGRLSGDAAEFDILSNFVEKLF
jgi:hypothetical protein